MILFKYWIWSRKHCVVLTICLKLSFLCFLLSLSVTLMKKSMGGYLHVHNMEEYIFRISYCASKSLWNPDRSWHGENITENADNLCVPFLNRQKTSFATVPGQLFPRPVRPTLVLRVWEREEKLLTCSTSMLYISAYIWYM